MATTQPDQRLVLSSPTGYNSAARERILARIRRLSLGNPGDIRSLGGGLSELRIAHGPGYRIYLMQEGSEVVTLLTGGDKRTRARDIAAARALVRQLRDAP